MSRITRFEDLPDLALFELFTYLSSTDVLWSFINVSHRLRTLLRERGFFQHINLTAARRFQFDALVALLPVHHIRTLTVHIGASPLQLARYPHLPALTTLRLYGIRDFEDTSNFLLRHARSLEHLTLDTNRTFRTCGFTGLIFYPRTFLDKTMSRQLPHLKALRSLDLGQETSLGLPRWDVSSIQCSLDYLRAPLQGIQQLCDILPVGTLSSSLQELHVTVRSRDLNGFYGLPSGSILPRLVNLHTFSLVQSIFSMHRIVWSTIEALTSTDVMPVLRKLRLAVFVTSRELRRTKRSTIFTDDRRIDVQFAFIVYGQTPGIALRPHVPDGSRFHPRPIAGATCVVNYLTRAYRKLADLDCYFDTHPLTYDVWYTLPWTFEQVFEELEPEVALTRVETMRSPIWDAARVSPSRLHTLTLSHNRILPLMTSLPHVVQLDRITSVRLWFHDWPTGLYLPNLRHVSMTNNLVALKSFASFPASIRSMQISLLPILPNHVSSNWSVLRSLSALPLISSLHIVLDHVKGGLDEATCQLIAERVLTLAHFGIHFRRRCSLPVPDYRPSFQVAQIDGHDLEDSDTDSDDSLDSHGYCAADEVSFLLSTLQEYRISIEKIRRRILRLPLCTEPVIVVEEEGCGLTAWM